MLEWVDLVAKRRASARLYLEKGVTFHPKVLIVRTDKLRFAVVGSANLSKGGFQDNVECSVFLTHKNFFRRDRELIRPTVQRQILTQALTKPQVAKYQPKYDLARKHYGAVRKAQSEIESDLHEKQIARLAKYKEAISACKRYFKSRDFKDWYPVGKKKTVKDIRKALDYPSFNFSQDGWDQFYGIGDLGSIRQSWKGTAWQKHRKMQEGFGT